MVNVLGKLDDRDVEMIDDEVKERIRELHEVLNLIPKEKRSDYVKEMLHQAKWWRNRYVSWVYYYNQLISKLEKLLRELEGGDGDGD